MTATKGIPAKGVPAKGVAPHSNKDTKKAKAKKVVVE